MTPFDVDRLQAELATVTGWSHPSRYEATGVHHLYSRSVQIGFGWVLEEFRPVAWAQVAAVHPGGFIAPHRDAGPYLERWHVPIVASGVFLQGGAVLHPEPGAPFRVEHWLPHSVWNPTSMTRVHLMIDRDITAAPTARFELFPVPAQYEYMVPKGELL